jgi:hypothetical protein
MVSGGSRRGESAGNTAILVAIIGGLLVGYILFLPPAEREKILFSDGSGGSYSGGGTYPGGGQGVFTQYGPVLVFRDTPGTLRLVKSPVVEHNIPSVTIYTTVNTLPVKAIDSAVVKNGVFARHDLDIAFSAERQSSRNFLLSFNVDEAGESPLRIVLNGHLIYERPVRERSPAPVPLPMDYLVDGENHLVIQSNDIGVAFWKSNTYLLHNILLSADVIDISNAESSQSFAIPVEELGTVESAQLQFVPECDPKKAGRLAVVLNSRVFSGANNTTVEQPNVIYSGMPDCGVMFKADVAKEALLPNNRIVFSSSGQYVIDRVKLVTHLKQNDYPVYYFNIPRDMYDSLDAGKGQLRLTLTFTDYRNIKTGETVVNGFVQSFSTKDYVYQAVIDPGVLTPGPNTIQVAPHVDRLDVAEVKIELV